eukprot:NODE_554_length_2109_cov_28.930097_g511_i0.p1 GENE.NODE_554_length_2109_cov_28.930097_g511_i0~~NODE_554_length_2109_cov_28.930097_g511_i0.p1  ORF type:complete len:605 (-),score=72.16 NODE_554_length_2109_cov_28.930097_g511_i0:161-1975(-)
MPAHLATGERRLSSSSSSNLEEGPGPPVSALTRYPNLPPEIVSGVYTSYSGWEAEVELAQLERFARTISSKFEGPSIPTVQSRVLRKATGTGAGVASPNRDGKERSSALRTTSSNSSSDFKSPRGQRETPGYLEKTASSQQRQIAKSESSPGVRRRAGQDAGRSRGPASPRGHDLRQELLDAQRKRAGIVTLQSSGLTPRLNTSRTSTPHVGQKQSPTKPGKSKSKRATSASNRYSAASPRLTSRTLSSPQLTKSSSVERNAAAIAQTPPGRVAVVQTLADAGLCENPSSESPENDADVSHGSEPEEVEDMLSDSAHPLEHALSGIDSEDVEACLPNDSMLPCDGSEGLRSRTCSESSSLDLQVDNGGANTETAAEDVDIEVPPAPSHLVSLTTSAFFSSVSWAAEQLRKGSFSSESFVPVNSGMTRESEIQHGLRTLQRRLQALGVKEQRMQDDGNCQFRAFSHQIYGHAEKYEQMRKLAVQQLTGNPDMYSMLFDKNEFAEYLSRIRKDCTWGDEITIKALCDALHVVVYVVLSTSGKWYHRYVPSDAADTCLWARQVFLSYLSPVHYNSLTYLDDSFITLTTAECETLESLNEGDFLGPSR